MGLDTSHDAWHGSYSAFARWRDTVAKAAGYQLVKVTESPFDQVLIDWGSLDEENIQGEWSDTPTDPLIVLIAHSDCDGVIHPEQAKPLADRLEALLPALDDDGVSNVAERTEQFIRGLRAAVEAREDLDFH